MNGGVRGLVVLLVAALLAVTACSRAPVVGKQGRANAFNEAATNYGKMLRWGYFDEAAAFRRLRDGETPASDLQRLARYRITAYDVKSQLIADTGRSGRVLALIEYYDVDSGVLHTLRDEQSWWFDDETKRWYLESDLPGFGVRGTGR